MDLNFEAKRDDRDGEISPYAFLLEHAPFSMAFNVAESIEWGPREWMDFRLSLSSVHESAKKESGELGPWRDAFHTYAQDELAISMLDQFTDLARRSGDGVIEIDRMSSKVNSEWAHRRGPLKEQLMDQTLGVLGVLNMGWTAACESGFLDGDCSPRSLRRKCGDGRARRLFLLDQASLDWAWALIRCKAS